MSTDKPHPKTTDDPWDACEHDWQEVESMCDRDVRCAKCGAPGDRDPITGEVYWPAT